MEISCLTHKNMQYWKRTFDRLTSSIKTDRNFPRNVPLRSTFHSVQPRLRNHALDYSGNGGGAAESPHTGRTSFFSKISSRFSKR
ncbi:uncharacterized protein LOC129571068 [Sitodiplosis mosellana]|uniref:uncharacterized protein LOC129571068 n=1 Tax=Sitodiplosis mosellana TaxID=263140 RepID=UPI002443DD44|nr:uncharacterized protein LOC129571068 [Sitodiplosis mosellana]